MNICLSGYYFVGSRGDQVLRKVISKDLARFGKVKVIYCESKAYEKVVDWCDVFVLGGGSLINSRGIGGYEQVKYAKDKGKKVMIYANTIEDGDPNFNEFMKCADAITVRDSKSFSVCQSHGFESVLSADPAIKIERRRSIHVGLRKWVTEPEDFLDRIVNILDELAHRHDLFLTPYTIKHTDTISDQDISMQVIKRMHKKAWIMPFKENSRCDLFIGMRFHSIISTIKRMIPTIAINYDRKVGNFMRDINKEEFLVEYDKVEEVPKLVRKIFLEEIIEREKKNVEVFKNLMKC